MNTLSPIPPESWPPSLDDVRRQMGTPLNVHCLLANHPDWLRAWFGFRNHVVHGTTLTARQFELIVLRVAVLTDAPYEWEHHLVTAREAGIADEEIERVRTGGDAPGWSDADALLLHAVDDCIDARRVSPSVLAAMASSYDPQQILDVVATVVMYHAMAIVTRTFDVAVDDHKPSFSAERADR